MLPCLKPFNPSYILHFTYNPDETATCLIGTAIRFITITNCPSQRDALDLITSPTFAINFLKASRAFVVHVKCQGSLLPLDLSQKFKLKKEYKDRKMVFSFENSGHESSVYYTDNTGLKCAAINRAIRLDQFLESPFSFELLLSKIYSDSAGTSFLDLKVGFDTVQSELLLMDLAVLDNNRLCIQFLQLFENPLSSIDKNSIRLVENAARFCDCDSLSALFDVNLNQKDFGLKNLKELAEVRDSRGYNMLMVSVERGNVGATLFWLNLDCFDVNFEVSGVTAGDLASLRGDAEILLMLLQKDSKYPENYLNVKMSEEMRMFCIMVNEMHEAIRTSNIGKVIEVLKNLRLRNYFDDSNKSAAYYALEMHELKIYKLLIMNNAAIGSHENLATLDLDTKTRQQLSNIHDHYKSPLYAKCVLDVEKKVHCLNILEQHRQKYQFEVRNALNLLYETETFRPILRIVGSKLRVIKLDFERDSVNYLDPTEGLETRGFYAENCISIGCKNLLTGERKNLFLATFIHEMTHFVLDFMYNNSCRPFVKDDKKRAVEFLDIYRACLRNADKEPIIKAVDQYAESQRFSELIVRRNHLLAHYMFDEPRQKECEQNFPELFKFYEESIHPNMLNILEWLEKDNYQVKPMKKRKIERKHFDVNFDIEMQNLLPKSFEKNSKNRKFFASNLKVSLMAAIFVFLTFLVVGFVFNSSLKRSGYRVDLLLKSIQLRCHNASHPWTELILHKNLSEIEILAENSSFELWRVNETCNPVTLSIEYDFNDLDFTKDLIDVAEDALAGCPGDFKRLLAECWKYLRENCAELEDIYRFINAKLEKLMDFGEHRMFIDGNYGKIGGKC